VKLQNAAIPVQPPLL